MEFTNNEHFSIASTVKVEDQDKQDPSMKQLLVSTVFQRTARHYIAEDRSLLKIFILQSSHYAISSVFHLDYLSNLNICLSNFF
jgi:hypothetical protein